MKRLLMISTILLLANCATKEFYTVCPVEVPKAWKRVPQGSLQYTKPKNGIYGCLNGECNIHLRDWQIVISNMAKCESTRQSLVDLFETVNDPKLRDPSGAPMITEPQPPLIDAEGFLKPVEPEIQAFEDIPIVTLPKKRR